MSKIFYDHLLVFEEIEMAISSHKLGQREKEEIGQMIEETIHHRVMTRILDHLPREHHEEFLKRFHQAPYDVGLLDFLKEKVVNIEEFIKDEIATLKKELLEDLKTTV